jgi:hypothetical protein
VVFGLVFVGVDSLDVSVGFSVSFSVGFSVSFSARFSEICLPVGLSVGAGREDFVAGVCWASGGREDGARDLRLGGGGNAVEVDCPSFIHRTQSSAVGSHI